MAKEFKLSAERLEELQAGAQLSEDRPGEGGRRQIKEARSFGDLSENSEYDEAKNEQGKLYSRIAEVEEILANYVVIEEQRRDGNSVRLGSTVTVLDKEFDEEEMLQDRGLPGGRPHERPYLRGLPLRQGPAGQRVGDEVLVDAPAGVLSTVF